LRNQASSRIHWFTIFGGKTLTAPGETGLDDHHVLKAYNPEREKRIQLTILASVGGISALLGLVLGRWWGKHSERKAEEERRKRYDYYTDSDYKRKRKRDIRHWEGFSEI
jgi:hypothetical protein